MAIAIAWGVRASSLSKLAEEPSPLLLMYVKVCVCVCKGGGGYN